MLTKFIPALWAAILLQNLHKTLVYAQPGVVNRDYEGEIRDKGDRVKINNIGEVTIGDYTKNTNIADPEVLTDDQRELVIDQGKFFNFQIDDIDKAQQNPKVMSEAMREAAYGLSDKEDQYIAGLYTGVAAGNTIGTDAAPVVLTADNAYERIVDLGVVLDEANIPRAQRYVIVPAWVHGLLLKDERFVKAGTSATDAVLRNGEVGRVAGFNVFTSNNVPNVAGAKYKIQAGHPMGIAAAEQIVSVEGYRPEKRFADAMKGLHVYGAKLIRPKAIAILTANKS